MNAAHFQRLLMRAAFSGAHVFAWVSICAVLTIQKGSIALGLSAVAFLYALTHVIVILLTPYVAKNLAHGMRDKMALGVLSGAAAFSALGIGHLVGDDALFASISIFAILLGIYRALYFTPYAVISGTSKRVAFLDILIVLLPALCGYLVMYAASLAQLFLAAAAVLAVSVIPIFWIRDRHEGFSWSYRETFHELFDSRHRALLISAICDGVEAAALLLVWPIVIWLALGGSMALLGIVISVTLLLAMLVRMLFKRMQWSPTPAQESLVQMSAWIFRTVAGNAGAIVLIDLYSGSASSRHTRGIDTATLEQAADNHTYVDEFTALKEMGNATGRIVLCMGVGLLAPLVSFGTTTAGVFVIAALLSAFSIYVSRRHARAAF